jgi:hypothetical protein
VTAVQDISCPHHKEKCFLGDSGINPDPLCQLKLRAAAAQLLTAATYTHHSRVAQYVGLVPF